jgi:hypothetical protein
MADEKVFEQLQEEIKLLKAAHQTFKDRVYELLGLEQTDPDPYSVIEVVEFKRDLWAKAQGWKPQNIKEAPKNFKRTFNPQPKPEKRR